jgi:hypothetical protein
MSRPSRRLFQLGRAIVVIALTGVSLPVVWRLWGRPPSWVRDVASVCFGLTWAGIFLVILNSERHQNQP